MTGHHAPPPRGVSEDDDADAIVRAGTTPFVFVGDDWGRHPSTSQHLATRVGAHFPVVWVDSFGHRAPRLTLRDARRAVEKVGAMLARPPRASGSVGGWRPPAVVSPRALPWHGVAAVRALNRWSMSRDVSRALARVAPGARPVVISQTPVGVDLMRALDPVATIYLCLDEYAEAYAVDRDLIAPFEAEMLSTVDGVVVTSRTLEASKRPATGEVLFSPQGVNYEHFATPMPEPAELAAIPRPRLGFVGLVGPAVDLPLVVALAEARPDAAIVLVGGWQHDQRSVALPPNVHAVGARSYAELPGWVQGFDVALVPYVHSAYTRAIDPLKLLEYLAAGTPVASTKLGEVLKYAHVVEVGDGASDFVAAVARAERAASDEARAARQAEARRHTWAVRADALIAFARRVAAQRAARTTSTTPAARTGRAARAG